MMMVGILGMRIGVGVEWSARKSLESSLVSHLVSTMTHLGNTKTRRVNGLCAMFMRRNEKERSGGGGALVILVMVVAF